MSKKLTAPTRAGGNVLPEMTRFQLRLHPVRRESVTALVPNPLNTTLFRSEDEQYFSSLRADIQKRGVLVPLIARQDGTLLAGHNRLLVAQELGLEYVPVQRVEENDSFELTDDDVREFMVKDNLLRRHFSSDEWLALYQQLYPDFEARIAEGGAGKRDGLTAAKIATDTGDNVKAVRKRLQRLRNTAPPSAGDEPARERPQNALRSATRGDLHTAIGGAIVALEQGQAYAALEILRGVYALGGAA